MAIKEKQQIPSPSNIKSSPITFSKEELEELVELKKDINQLSFDLGQLSINKIKLEENENILKKELYSIESKEKDLAKKLTKKYGKGSIDLETGTFTPIQ